GGARDARPRRGHRGPGRGGGAARCGLRRHRPPPDAGGLAAVVCDEPSRLPVAPPGARPRRVERMSRHPLSGKNIVLGVAGSIAAYKAAELASRLVQVGAQVDTVMTREATAFVAPLTFQALTHRPVIVDLFDPRSELAIDHVAVAKRADAILLAPATAQLIARLAAGMADDAVTATVLAAAAPVVICPAMETNMYRHPATQAN